MYDYDACLLYHEQDEEKVRQLAKPFIEDSQLQFVFFSVNDASLESLPTALEQTLQRTATMLVFLSANFSFLNSPLHKELGQRDLRLILVALDANSAEKHHSPVDFINYQNPSAEALRVLEAVILGYKLSPINYQDTEAVHKALRLNTVISGVFLPSAAFTHRQELEAVHEFWQNEAKNGVLALVGTGGSGKTSLLLHFLQQLPNNPLSDAALGEKSQLAAPNGVFLWSFYDNPNIEYFIRGLYKHLTGIETTNPARDIVYKLIRQLETQAPTRFLLALDGIELVQEGRNSLGEFGLIRDSSLRHFVRRIALGDLPVKMIITSRFPLPELKTFLGKSYWQIDMDHLGTIPARNFLREAGLHGTDSELDGVIDAYGDHSLTLKQLTHVLKAFFGAKLLPALHFPASSSNHEERQAHRLARVLDRYIDKLSSEELAVIHLLSVLRKPIEFSLLASFFDSQKHERLSEIPSLTAPELRQILNRLQSFNLIDYFGDSSEKICTIHPAIRDYFAAIEPTVNHKIHFVERQRIFSLLEQGGHFGRQTNPRLLEIYENLIYHTVYGQDGDDVLQMYDNMGGGYTHLAWRLGDYQRGLRITTLLKEALGSHYVNVYLAPAHEHNLFLLNLGQVALAENLSRELIAHCEELAKAEQKQNPSWENPFGYFKDDERSYARYKVILIQTLCDTLLAQGKALEAKALLDEVLSIPRDWSVFGTVGKNRTGSNPYGRRAIAAFLLGESELALRDFTLADTFAREHTKFTFFRSANWHHKAFHALLLARLGKLSAAMKRLATLDYGEVEAYRPLSSSYYDLAAAEIAYLKGNSKLATSHVEKAFAWSLQSGHRQVYNQALLIKARLFLREKAFDAAIQVLDELEENSRNHQLTIQLIDSLILKGHLALENNNATQSQIACDEALTLSTSLMYRWGMGDAAYLMAKVLFQQKRLPNALEFAVESLELRRFCQDPRSTYSEKLIQAINEGQS